MKDRYTIWDGVRNYQARNFLKSMKVGDLAFFYHSNCQPPGIVGSMVVVESMVIDPTQFDPTSDYYDPKSTPQLPRWHTVKVEFREKFSEMITLEKLRSHFTVEELTLLKRGNRLSVIPLTSEVAVKLFQIVTNNQF
jgi:predicted RNA-binding protein with PUA-like domain